VDQTYMYLHSSGSLHIALLRGIRV
jgi:hypothetical protein